MSAPGSVSRRVAGFALVASACAAAQAAPTAYTTVLPSSTVTFSATQMGVKMPGRFERLSAQVDFVPAAPAQSRVSVSVDAASVNAGSGQTNALLAGTDWLDAKAYPQARFVSTRFDPAGPGRYWVSGTFTVKGRSRPLRVLVVTHPTGADLALDADFTLQRTAFGLGTGSWADTGVVAAAIPVHVHLLLAPKG